ncbi:MAG: glutamate 5-kinase [Myxococcota bacterium]|nr:glutamate 5-kinase [Myxococcota bacterium]
MQDAQPQPFTRQHLSQCRRIVIKVGSALLSEAGSAPFERFAAEIATLMQRGHYVVVVSSGAIAQGLPVLGFKTRPLQLGQQQAAAATGQPLLMQRWNNAFSAHNIPVAQVLLTHAGLANRERFLNARHALHNLEKRDVLPIANENDTVATDEIRVGDNDQLAAHVASLVGADLLILLTTVPGLYTANPERDTNAERIPLVLSPKDVMQYADSAGSSGLGTGGMKTKLKAADTAISLGIPVVIAGGDTPGTLEHILAGDDTGTLFLPKKQLQGRKHWIGFTLRAQGTLHVDAGAAQAIIKRGKSLLPTGITAIEGQFKRGEMVDIRSPDGLIARGLVGYSSEEVQLVLGRPSQDIASILGYVDTEEIIDRDDLVVLNDA